MQIANVADLTPSIIVRRILIDVITLLITFIWLPLAIRALSRLWSGPREIIFAYIFDLAIELLEIVVI